MSVTLLGTWYRLAHLPIQIGLMVHRVLNAITALPSMEILGETRTRKKHRRCNGIYGLTHRKKTAAGIGYDWTGMSYQSVYPQTRPYAVPLFQSSLFSVWRRSVSWSIPFAVMLVVPLGVVGAFISDPVAWVINDVCFQVGLPGQQLGYRLKTRF